MKKIFIVICFTLAIIILGLLTYSYFSYKSQNLNDGFSDLKPMYGASSYDEYIKNRTSYRKVVDDQFITDSIKLAGPEAQSLTDLGFVYLQKGDFSTSMKRFNEAWLINQNNFRIFWGYGDLLSIQADANKGNKNLYLSDYEQASHFFDLALSNLNSASSTTNDVLTLKHDAGQCFQALASFYGILGGHEVEKKLNNEKSIALLESSLADPTLTANLSKNLIFDDIIRLGIAYGSEGRLPDVKALVNKYTAIYPELKQNKQIQFMTNNSSTYSRPFN